MTRLLTVFVAVALFTACDSKPDFIITVLGTNDVHGELVATDKHAGVETFSGYVTAMREARTRDGGGVVLVDSGDMWQGTLESNLSEGAAMVSAYNALGYDAVAIGNHEFDFGPLGPDAIPTAENSNPVEALRQRATEASFPLLAANLADATTGERVAWENVPASTMIEVNGIKVGIIGVMTRNALQRTIAANVSELQVLPLVPAIIEEATQLKAAGATLVIVAAHAGGECETLDDPLDLSTCNAESEIFQVARALPPGLINHINAGHVHKAMAHVINGISITSAWSSTRAFSRVDFTMDGHTGEILHRQVYAPHDIVIDGEYEGRQVEPQADVLAIANRAMRFASEQKAAPVGIRLETAFDLTTYPDSTLGKLFTSAIRDATGADIVIHNVRGGLRQILPAGELTFGDVYAMSPFDNRIVKLRLSGLELRSLFAAQDPERLRIDFAGIRVAMDCANKRLEIVLRRPDGSVVEDSDSLTVIINDYMALGGDSIMDAVMPDAGYEIDESQPLVRDLFLKALTETGGSINAADYASGDAPRWHVTDNVSSECTLDF